MWQMSSVSSHESAQRNDAGHLIDKMSLKQHGQQHGQHGQHFVWRIQHGQ